jgi:putative endonuclease
MSHRVYILQSVALDRYYVGITERGERRLQEHRSKHKGWTSQADDWTETYGCQVATRTEARELEKQIKARGAVRWLADRKRNDLPCR